VGGPRDAGHARPDRGDGRGLGSSSNVTLMAARLVADGYRPYTVNLDLLGIDTVGNANRIRAEVDQTRATTGASKVHLVGHSMGGPPTRYYIKILGGQRHVAPTRPRCLPASGRRWSAW
jgi:triacylglycerol lipase